MDDDMVKMKARSTGGKGRGRGHGHGKTARTSLPRPGKSNQDVTDSKKEDKGVRKNEKKTTRKINQKAIGEQEVQRQTVIERLD